jgi:hypothetical protein
MAASEQQGGNGMEQGGPAERIARLLLVATLVHAAFFAFGFASEFATRNGLLIDTHAPFGGDFINLWTVAQLVLSGDWGAIYDFERLMAVEQQMVGADISVRFWAYPPHSLFLVWPFGLVGYLGAFGIWSLFGLAALAFGARRYGLSWVETGVLAPVAGLSHVRRKRLDR